ncbi:MAG: hypothetical protein MZU91_12330 [Desulfosudis oleivorans]|nr:hypothetical protein [Desulfosudis oleivorans]
MPFFVHMVTNPSEMTQFADIVLPSTFNSAEGWSIVTQHGQRPWLRVDPAGGRQAPVGRQAGRDRGDVAAGREAQGQGLPEPLRLLLARNSRTRRPASCRPRRWSSARSPPRSPARRCGWPRSR